MLKNKIRQNACHGSWKTEFFFFKVILTTLTFNENDNRDVFHFLFSKFLNERYLKNKNKFSKGVVLIVLIY